MPTPETIRLHARLEIQGDHLTGHVTRAGGDPISFSGWIGLLGAVEDACQAPDESNDSERRPSGDKESSS